MGGRVADDAVFADLFPPGFKLRLDQTDAHGIRRGDGLRHREDMMQRDERHIHAEKLHRLFQLVEGHIADVGSLHVDDPRIGAQAPCQLAVAHIHRIDLDCSVLEHTIGEAAGRGTDVHADLALRRQRETLHCLFQFESAAADITDVVAAYFHHGVLFDHLTGFVHLLIVDKDHAGHDHRFCPLPALDQPMLNQILIQSHFQSVASPFAAAFRISCARCAASSPVTCLICGTVAWGRQTFSTARWR